MRVAKLLDLKDVIWSTNIVYMIDFKQLNRF